MRIGSLQNISLQKWKPNDQRDLFVKSIPGYNMPLTFDLNSSMRSHVIDGTLVDSSNANLAADMEYLEGLFRSGQLVWVDATDQYIALCAFGKIAKLQGPTIDASQGQYVAKFTMEFWSLPPWGVTMFNPYRQTGLKLRDLDGVGAEYILDPTQMNCNYTLSEIGQSAPYSLSWEFIIENQNPFTNATSVQISECDSVGSGTASASNPIAIDPAFGVSAFDSISIDYIYFKSGTASLKGSKTSPSATTWYGMAYDFGSSGIDISSYDRLRIWYRCDETGQNNYWVQIRDTNGQYMAWSLSLQGANVWLNAELSLSAYVQNTGIDLTKVRYIGPEVQIGATPPSSINVWVDDIRLERGYLTHCSDTSSWSNSGNIYSSGNFYTSIANDSIIYKNSYSGVGAGSLLSGVDSETSPLAAVKFSGAVNNTIIGVFSLPAANWDFSGYDFLLLWVRSDFGGLATGSFIISIGPSYNNCYAWTYSGLNASQWYRLVIPLKNPGLTTGTVSLSSIAKIQINATANGTSNTTNVWVDEIALDEGQKTYLEFQIPDNISQAETTNALIIYNWNCASNSYSLVMSESVEGEYSGGANVYYLDGSKSNNPVQVYGFYPSIYPVGEAGEKVTYGSEGSSHGGGNQYLTYTTTYGTKNRFGWYVLIPPATSDSLSGNLPSNDLSGFQAINKIQVKVLVHFENDDTTYFGFNTL